MSEYYAMSRFQKTYRYLRFRLLDRREAFKHLLNWILFGVFDELFNPKQGNIVAIVSGVASFVVPCMLVYYAFILIVFPSFGKRNNLLLILCFIFLYLLFAQAEYLNISDRIRSGAMGLPAMFFDSLLIVGLTGIVAFSSFTNWRAKMLIKDQDEKERYLISNEFSSIETQFNSEMTSRFLDFIRSEVSIQSKDADMAVALFSKIIQYTFQIKSDETVPLQQELVYLSNYIDLQKCIHKNTFVNLAWSGQIGGKQVYPRILISFLENAFKHGVADDPESPILITLQIGLGEIDFKIENKKELIKKKVFSGLGQKNVKDVLDLFYPGNYRFNISETPKTYSVSLSLIDGSL